MKKVLNSTKKDIKWRDLSEDVVGDPVVEAEGDSIIDIEFLSTGSDVDRVRRRRRRPHCFCFFGLEFLKTQRFTVFFFQS